jgi:hypothetical protein
MAPKAKNIYRKFEHMSSLLYSKRLVVALLCAGILLLSSCKKAIEQIQETTLQKYFEDNILNRQFVVELASDTATIKTGDFAGYEFVLKKGSDLLGGPMTGTKAGVTYTGTWTSNEDYGKLVISLNAPAPPAYFNFINRSWRFTKKSLPIMELAPWGSTDPKILHMRRL